MESWVIRWRHYLLFHVQEANHFIEIEVIRRRALRHLSPAVYESFEGHSLRTMHIE